MSLNLCIILCWDLLEGPKEAFLVKLFSAQQMSLFIADNIF